MLNWGIIGTGFVAYEIAYAINSLPGNKIKAVASRTLSNAQQLAQTLDVKEVYDDYRKILNDKEVKIIYIALPNHLHAKVMKECLENGKHILCEKPFALNAIQAREIQKLAMGKGLFCMEAFWTRFLPSVEKVKELISQGQIGNIKTIRGSFGHVFTQKRGFDLNSGGGSLLDLGVYLVSLTHALVGKPDHVNGNLILGETGVDVQGAILLKYNSGLLASLTCSYTSELDNEFVIYGDRGSLKLCIPFYRTSTIEIKYYGGKTETVTSNAPAIRRNYFSLPGPLKYSPVIVEQIRRLLPLRNKNLVVPFIGNGYQYQISHVVDCLKNKQLESSKHPLSSTIEILEILDAIRKNENFKYPEEY